MTVGQRSGSFTTTIETVNILPPIIAVQETNIIVNPDDAVRIPCTVTSHGPVMMMWTGFSKDGNFLNLFLYFNWLFINTQFRNYQSIGNT